MIRSLDRLSHAEKRSLAVQAKEEYRRLPEFGRQKLLDVLQSGTLPVPRDLRDSMIAEFNAIGPARARRTTPRVSLIGNAFARCSE